jgi:hypothetical protein
MLEARNSGILLEVELQDRTYAFGPRLVRQTAGLS